MNDTIGIDISKDSLDTYWLPARRHKQFANTRTGLRALVRRFSQSGVSLVVFEATGVYHRLLENPKAVGIVVAPQFNTNHDPLHGECRLFQKGITKHSREKPWDHESETGRFGTIGGKDNHHLFAVAV
jgi:hypothetical protein